MLSRWVQIASESTPWVESLAATDPVVFPLIFLTASLANIQINALRKLTVPQTKLQIAIPWVLRVCVTGIAVFAMFTPSVSYPTFTALRFKNYCCFLLYFSGCHDVLGHLECVSLIAEFVP
jgi:hypothetical protein